MVLKEKKPQVKKSKGLGGFLRLVRSILLVFVLSALILGISLGVKEASSIDEKKIGRALSLVFSKVHINVNEDQAGEVAGKFAERISQTNLGSGVSTSRQQDSSIDLSNSTNVYASQKVILSVAIIGDVHQDTDSLKSVLDSLSKHEISDNNGISKVFVIGDLTNYGDVESLSNVKKILDSSIYDYNVLPGDHDLAASLDLGENMLFNYDKVFNDRNSLITIGDYDFMVFDNSPNFTVLSPNDISFFEENIVKADFIILSQPLFTEGLSFPFSKMYMGSTWNTVEESDLIEKQDKVKAQGEFILEAIRNSNVKAIISADHHKYSKLLDNEKTDLSHYVVGSISDFKEQDNSNISFGNPSYSLLKIFSDGSYKIEEVMIN